MGKSTQKAQEQQKKHYDKSPSICIHAVSKNRQGLQAVEAIPWPVSNCENGVDVRPVDKPPIRVSDFELVPVKYTMNFGQLGVKLLSHVNSDSSIRLQICASEIPNKFRPTRSKVPESRKLTPQSQVW